MSAKIDEYQPYIELTNEQTNIELDKIMELWEKFLAQYGLDYKINEHYFVHSKNLYEIIRRVNKRKVYYKVFHKLEKINEYKEIAIICYWINTLKPFFVCDPNSPIYDSPNEMFSVFIIFCTIQKLFDEANENSAEKKSFEYPCDARIEDMVYNFKFCGLSRESTIAFVETLADNYGIGINYILQRPIKGNS